METPDLRLPKVRILLYTDDMSVRWNDRVHVMFSTRGHWLPVDPRGFRNRDHRIHSSGDYTHPPRAANMRDCM